MSKLAICNIGYFNRSGELLRHSDVSYIKSLSYETRYYVIEDATNPSSVGSPTIKEYIEREAVLGNIVSFISQAMIITTPYAAVESSNWLLRTGSWDDSGVWDDSAIWEDGGEE